MTNHLTTHFKKSASVGNKNWLYVQDAEVVIVPTIQGWNEGYLPSNKFLYFSEATSTSVKKAGKK